MMNTQQIDYIIRRHVRGFDGIFISDTLPPDNPRLLVANTQPSDRPGEHWSGYLSMSTEMETENTSIPLVDLHQEILKTT